VKVIVMSGPLDPAQILELESMGVNTFPAKPFTPERLLSAISESLN
jgi:DNA-binding NtrC family response regulator